MSLWRYAKLNVFYPCCVELEWTLILQPGLDPGMSEPLQTESGKKAYIAMKVLKSICGAKVTSYQVKKVLSTLYNDWGKNLPEDEIK